VAGEICSSLHVVESAPENLGAVIPSGVSELSAVNQCQALAASVKHRGLETKYPSGRIWRCRPFSSSNQHQADAQAPAVECPNDVTSQHIVTTLCDRFAPRANPQAVDPLYLFACHIEWERAEEPTAGWELISAANSPDGDTRAHARALLSGSRRLGGTGQGPTSEFLFNRKKPAATEADMKAPYGLDIVDNCTECTQTNPAFFCAFSDPVLQSLDQISHKSVLPPDAILFVEGQEPRGLFIICSGKVNLSTTSREGKLLILKTAVPGEVLGLSATISGMNYEITAETATPCQVSFIDRKRFLAMMELHGETGLHAALSLSRDYHSAYRDIHDLVLTRSSLGKLARLLLSQAALEDTDDDRIDTQMTHEEMAQRIGASRETVTRLLTRLRHKRLIRMDGPSLVIRNRVALEAIAG
jgi:CRP/FNR family cyclic AMP-dependent transcriptional regulator